MTREDALEADRQAWTHFTAVADLHTDCCLTAKMAKQHGLLKLYQMLEECADQAYADLVAARRACERTNAAMIRNFPPA
ncbi:hypothetical protein [Thiomonas sp.]